MIKPAFAYAFLVLFLSDPALANSIITECPATKPGKPTAHFVFGAFQSDKSGYSSPIPDKFYRENGILYAEFPFIHPSMPWRPSDNEAFIICEYSDKSEISIPIPGRLERCGVNGKELAQKPKVKMKWIRAWCASTPLQ
jgi:hypothetical protein